MPNSDPVTAWKALKQGNERFVAGKPEHPSQSIEHRASLAATQKPIAVVFGCADSRVAAEIIFDQGLGDMFVVRTAGHVTDSAVLGSVEYAVTVLNVPLVVVLGHDSCGAIKATLTALDDGVVPGGYVRDVVERVTPSILSGRREGLTRVDEFETRHVTETATQLIARSTAIAERVTAGTLAIVGVTYQLADGRVTLRGYLGDIGEGQRGRLSWLNQIERWFALLTDKQLCRGAHQSVPALENDIRDWINDWNDDPKPFAWTKTADDILERLASYLHRIPGAGHQ